jgi:hypothetical protein
MSGAGIRLYAKVRGQMPRIATTGITSWQTALKWTAECQVPRSGCCGQVKLLSGAIRATVILFLAIRVLNAADCHNPRHTFERGTWQEKRLNSSSRHFTSRVPLFEASYLIAARLLEYKIPCLRGGLFRPKLNTNGLSCYTFLVTLYL